MDFYQVVGYNLNFKDLVKTEKSNNKNIYFVFSNNQKKIIPSFLVEKNYEKTDQKNLFDGIKILNDFLEKSILKPNNLQFPRERLDFLNNLT